MFEPSDFDRTGGSSSNNPPVSGNMATPREPQKGGIFSFEYYSWFFDVETSEVAARCLLALNPFSQVQFIDHDDGFGLEGGDGRGSGLIVGGYPDLYGPFWLCSTVVFMLFFASTLAGVVFSSLQNAHYENQFDVLTGAAGLMYAYTFLVPLGLFFVVRYTNIAPSVTLLQFVCLYGYSNAIWIFVAILSLLSIVNSPVISNVIRWILVAVGYSVSGSFIAKNLYKAVVPAEQGAIEVNKKPAMAILIGAVLLHTVLAFAVKMLFFGITVYSKDK